MFSANQIFSSRLIVSLFPYKIANTYLDRWQLAESSWTRYIFLSFENLPVVRLTKLSFGPMKPVINLDLTEEIRPYPIFEHPPDQSFSVLRLIVAWKMWYCRYLALNKVHIWRWLCFLYSHPNNIKTSICFLCDNSLFV